MKLTMAQALVKFLDNQYVSFDGEETKFVDGIFGIFGHGEILLQDNSLRVFFAVHLHTDNITRSEGMRHAVILCRYGEEQNITDRNRYFL